MLTKIVIMAYINRRELAEQMGVSRTHVHMWIKRGKVFEQQNLINTDYLPNKEFIRKMSEKRGVSSITGIKKKPHAVHAPKENIELNKQQIIEPSIPSNPIPVTDKPMTQREIDIPDEYEIPEEHLINMSFERKKKYLDIELQESKLRLDRIKEEKQMGLLIPVDLVKSLFSVHFKSIITEFHQAAEGISIDFASRLGGNREDEIIMRSKLYDIINNAVSRSSENSIKSLNKTIDEFLQKGNTT